LQYSSYFPEEIGNEMIFLE